MCKNPDVAIIPAHELQRMKQEAVVASAAELEAQRKIAKEQIDQQQAIAKAKAKRMMELADERKASQPPTDLEIEDEAKLSALRKKAEEIHNENRDEVKKMNQLVDYLD